MPMPEGKTSLSKMVDKDFRELYGKQNEFWKEFREFFVALVGEVAYEDWQRLKEEYPKVIKFLEEYI